MIQEALEKARELAHENRLEGKDLDELAELEDEEDEDFLDSYRKKRMAELSSINTASVYNQVYHLQKPDYSRDVTEASKDAYVLVLLTSSTGTNTESRIMIEHWRDLAKRFGDVKFCQMRADLCIEGYPDKNTPTVLIYKDGDIKRQIVTLMQLAGPRTTVQGKLWELLCNERDYADEDMIDLEKVLVDVGAVKIGDSRLQRKKDDEDDESSNKIRKGTTTVEDDDSDWD